MDKEFKELCRNSDLSEIKKLPNKIKTRKILKLNNKND